MLSDDKTTNKVSIHLYGGEQDGYRTWMEIRTVEPPKRFYIWRCNDQATIDAAKGKNRMVLQGKLATLAYELFAEETVGGETEYRYRRCESADKVTADPV